MAVPILVLSDAPDSSTGLGRITRDLASLLSSMEEFRVGTLGRGGFGSRGLPWIQYTFGEQYQWGEQLLPRLWEDFSGGSSGALFTIWDPSRLHWLGAPQYLPTGPLKELIGSGRMKRWGYFPVDAYGPQGKLSTLAGEAVKGFDRVLAYSKFGQRVLGQTLNQELDFIPHGIHGNIFTPRDAKLGRWMLQIPESKILVGCVMTNQARKDWGLWAQMAAELVKSNSDYHFWIHTDVMERYWSFYALIEDFGLKDHITFSPTSPTDEQLSYYYSACNITVLPSLGEGFGYPIAESLACGVPVIHHNYGAGSEIIPEYESTGFIGKLGVIQTRVAEGMGRLDTLHNVYRPNLYVDDWVNEVRLFTTDVIASKEDCRSSVEHLFWKNLAPTWKNWFRQGVK